MKFKARGDSAVKFKQKGSKHRSDTNSKSSVPTTLFADFVKKKDSQSSQMSGTYIKKSKFKLNSNATSAQQSAFELHDVMDSTYDWKSQKKHKKLKCFPEGEWQNKVEKNPQSNENMAFNLSVTYKNSNKWNIKKLNKSVPEVPDPDSVKQELKPRSSDTCEDQTSEYYPFLKKKGIKSMREKKKLKSGLQSKSENNMLTSCMQEAEVPQQRKKLKKKSKEIKNAESNACSNILGAEEGNINLISKANATVLSKAVKYEECTPSHHSKKKKKRSLTESSDLQLCETDELWGGDSHAKKYVADISMPRKKKHKKFKQRSVISDSNNSASGIKNKDPELDIILRCTDRKVKCQGGKKRKREQLISKNSDLISDVNESCSGIDDQDKNFRLDYRGSENLEQKKNRRKRIKHCFDDVMNDSKTASNVIVPSNSDTSIKTLENTPIAADENISESKEDLLETESSKIDSSGFIKIPKKELRGFEGREDTPERLCRTLFVGNLPLSMNRKVLQVLFRNFGKIESVRLRSVVPVKSSIPKKVALIKKEFHSESDSVNGYVVFTKQEDARKALVLNKTVFQGHHIRVDLFKNSSMVYDNKRSVFIGNLPFNATDESLWAVFGECGSIEAVRVVRDPTTRVGKGFGFVLFEESDSVKHALSLNETEVNGRRIRVKTVEKEKKLKEKRSEGNQRVNFQIEKKNVSRSGWRSAGQKKTKKKLIKKKRDVQKKKSLASILTH